MAAGSPVGHIALWDLEEKKLMCQMQDAHSTAIAGMTFVPGEPLLITNGADNALRVSYSCCCSLKPRQQNSSCWSQLDCSGLSFKDLLLYSHCFVYCFVILLKNKASPEPHIVSQYSLKSGSDLIMFWIINYCC